MANPIYPLLLQELQTAEPTQQNLATLAQQLLAQHGNVSEALSELAQYTLAEGQLEWAKVLLQKALAIDPLSVPLHEQLAQVLIAQDQPKQALALYEKAVSIQPSARLYSEMGRLLEQDQHLVAAMRCYEQALQMDNTYSRAWDGLGIVFSKQFNAIKAFQCFEKALSFDPTSTDSYHNLGMVLASQGEYTAAVQCYQEALRLDPERWQTRRNLGTIHFYQGHFTEALQCFEHVLSQTPNEIETQQWVARIYFEQGQVTKAVVLLRGLLQRSPTPELQHGIWTCLLFFLRADPACSNMELYQACREWGNVCASAYYPKNPPHFVQSRDPQRRLRVGYVSPDLRGHSIALMYGLLFEHHDRQQVELFAYSDVKHPDAVTAYFQSLFTQWQTTVNLSDTELAQRIRDDQIDILVDLAGHTANHRLLVFAQQPAPLQMTGFGFTSTSGLMTMQGCFTDPVLSPVNEHQGYTEKMLTLSHLHHWSSPNFELPPTSLPALKNGYVTFGCGNNLFKINAPVMALWAEILHQLPQSRLYLKANAFRDAATEQLCRDQFVGLGIEPERLQLFGTTSWQEHMHFYQQLDMALDPFPYGGGITTAETLWAGVPVICLNQGTRASASVLAAVGIADTFLAQTPVAYRQKCVTLAENLPQLADWRNRLPNLVRQSRLCDGQQFAHEVEAHYREQWQMWCQTT